MRKRYCVELMLSSLRPDDTTTIDVWVWADDIYKARSKVESRLQRLLGDDRAVDPGPDQDDG